MRAGPLFRRRSHCNAPASRRRSARSSRAPAGAECTLVLAQGIPKGQKMDYVVEKASELGVASLIPLVTERSIADASPAKLERWRRLARAAAAQSGRARPAEIEAPLDWAELCAQFSRFDRVIVPWERAERVPLRERLASSSRARAASRSRSGPKAASRSVKPSSRPRRVRRSSRSARASCARRPPDSSLAASCVMRSASYETLDPLYREW